MTTQPEPGARRALLIGIDDYQHENISKLQGCVNDVRLMKVILEDNFGFPSENITKIENGEATRDGVLATFDRFVDETGDNDIVVIHYAGHGSLMTDREGDEPSGYDSTIMPIDSPGWRGDNKDISDDEIHLRLARLAEKTPYITMIFDCCHSGTISRDSFGEMARSMPPDTRDVSELPPSPIPRSLWASMRESGPSGWLPLTDKYVLIAGCRDEEVSYEYRPPEGGGDLVHGALTYFLTGELRKATSGTTYRDIFELAAAKVNANNRKQHPQMEGSADREIFGVRTLAPMTFVRVTARDGSRVELGAGAAQGMAVGSLFEVHPPGTKNTTDSEKIGVVELTKVRAVTSEARIVEESTDGSIVQDTRAFEFEHAYGAFTFDVQVVAGPEHEADAAKLRERIARSGLLNEVEASAPASARVYALSPRATVSESDPVPQLGAIERAVWAAVNVDGNLAMPAKSLGQTDDVIENLEKLARYRHAIELDNPDQDSGLRGKFELELLRKAADGSWVPATADAASNQIIYHEGDPIAFKIRSLQAQNEQAAFVTLMDFGLSGGIDVMYPASGAGEKLRPGGWFGFGTEEGDDFTVGFPAVFPFAEGGGAVEGVETVKLIVTSGQVDFSFMNQSGVRGAPAPRTGGSPFESLWETALRGPTTREIVRKPVKPESQEDWTTVSKSFVLRRRSSKPLASDGSAVALEARPSASADTRPTRRTAEPEATISTPGLSGVVEAHPWQSDRAAASELPSGLLTDALGDAGVDVRQTIEVSEIEQQDSGSRSGAPPVIELSLREPEPGYGQMVMTTDEQGVISWHFAAPPEAGSRSGGAPGGLRSYSIPATPKAAPSSSAQRGLVGAVGRKFLKELVFPLIDPVIGAVTNTFVGSWEGKNRPYRVRRFTPDDYKVADAGLIEGDEWARLASGRALLLVHGTFSRAHSAFGEMPKDFVDALQTKYEGRVFALDHYTLSHDPKKNVSWFFEQIPPDISLDVDIICHSRGGLVSRVLSEKQSEFSLGSRSLRIGNVIFVATPNAGTVLADSNHIGDLIDTFTNLANFIPDVGVSDIVAGVIAVAKQVAVGAFGGLPGLKAMVPGGTFAADLNTGARTGDTRYFAIASDYSPSEPGLVSLAKDRLMDLVFKGGNDLVVPTDGVYADNGSGFFPIEDTLVFRDAQSLAHTEFFGKRVVTEKIAAWLSA